MLDVELKIIRAYIKLKELSRSVRMVVSFGSTNQIILTREYGDREEYTFRSLERAEYYLKGYIEGKRHGRE